MCSVPTGCLKLSTPPLKGGGGPLMNTSPQLYKVSYSPSLLYDGLGRISHVRERETSILAFIPLAKSIVYSSVLRSYLFYTQTEAYFLDTIFYILKNSIVKYTWLILKSIKKSQRLSTVH